MKKHHRLTTLLLIAAMTMNTAPMAVFAAETEAAPETETVTKETAEETASEVPEERPRHCPAGRGGMEPDHDQDPDG